MEGAFNKLIAYSKINNREITLELAEEALKKANLTKKDIINSNFINKSDLLRYAEKINDDDYVFTGQKNNFTKPLSRQHVHHILRKHVSF